MTGITFDELLTYTAEIGQCSTTLSTGQCSTRAWLS